MQNGCSPDILQSLRDGLATCRRFREFMRGLVADVRARGPPAPDDTSVAALLMQATVSRPHSTVRTCVVRFSAPYKYISSIQTRPRCGGACTAGMGVVLQGTLRKVAGCASSGIVRRSRDGCLRCATRKHQEAKRYRIGRWLLGSPSGSR